MRVRTEREELEIAFGENDEGGVRKERENVKYG